MARDDRMEAYLKIVKELAEKFGEFTLTRIPHGENTSVDALATLASTADPNLERIILIEFIRKLSISLPEAVNVITQSRAAELAREEADKVITSEVSLYGNALVNDRTLTKERAEPPDIQDEPSLGQVEHMEEDMPDDLGETNAHEETT